MSAAVWSEPQGPDCGRRDVGRSGGGPRVGGGALIVARSPRPGREGPARTGEPSRAETD